MLSTVGLFLLESCYVKCDARLIVVMKHHEVLYELSCFSFTSRLYLCKKTKEYAKRRKALCEAEGRAKIEMRGILGLGTVLIGFDVLFE